MKPHYLRNQQQKGKAKRTAKRKTKNRLSNFMLRHWRQRTTSGFTRWDDADNKTRSLIYLSLGAQATNVFHQRYPHTDIKKCTTDALVEQLKKRFVQTRNRTFDRFQFFWCRQKEGESLDVFHSRINKCRTMQLAPFGWETSQKNFYTRQEQQADPNGSTLRRHITQWHNKKGIGKRKRTSKSTENE